jgi:fumarylacetoacetase
MADGGTFLEDGDEVVLRYSAPGTGGGRISLGDVVGRIEPAR